MWDFIGIFGLIFCAILGLIEPVIILLDPAHHEHVQLAALAFVLSIAFLVCALVRWRILAKAPMVAGRLQRGIVSELLALLMVVIVLVWCYPTFVIVATFK